VDGSTDTEMSQGNSSAPLLGHSSTVMTARYAHLSDRMLREATDKAGKLLAAPEAEA
jgi:integrase